MILKNQVLNRKNNKPIVYDYFFNDSKALKPLVIFCHGYKGFKDWGSWNIVANAFLKANIFFVKFNFSHNGGTAIQPIDFPDLKAFAENNYSKELEDLEAVINHVTSSENSYLEQIDTNNITLIGHSRGGGICAIKASEDRRIKQLITWASVADFEKRTATTGDLEAWQKNGVKYVFNSRTKQQMPHNFQFYKDFKANANRLNIKRAVKDLKIPFLIIHAIDDPSVTYKEALLLNSWCLNSTLLPITNSNHVFGAKHPWDKKRLPKALQTVVLESIVFIPTT
ncbi:alpha/beta hydrolase family protein [Lacinutrix salivirga]